MYFAIIVENKIIFQYFWHQPRMPIFKENISLGPIPGNAVHTAACSFSETSSWTILCQQVYISSSYVSVCLYCAQFVTFVVVCFHMTKVTYLELY